MAIPYTPRFDPNGQTVFNDSFQPIARIDASGSFMLQYGYELSGIRVDTSLKKILESYGHIENNLGNRLYGETLFVTLFKDREYSLDDSQLEKGFDGNAALGGILEMSYEISLEHILKLLQNNNQPDFIIPGRGARGTIIIDRINGVAYTAKKVVYPIHFLYITDGLKKMDLKLAEEAVETLFLLNYELIKDSSLDVFEDFLKGIEF